MTDNQEQTPDASSEEQHSQSGEILAEGIADLLNKPEVSKAFGVYISSAGENLKTNPTTIRLVHVLNLLFNTGLFIGIAWLGYQKIISNAATTGLIGTLLGYWFGQRQAKK